MECNKLKNVMECRSMPYSQNVTECRSRNNAIIRHDLQTDLGTYIS